MITMNAGEVQDARSARPADAGRRMLSRYTGTTVFAVGAHPDDIELGMGGTAALLTKLGAHVIFVICSIPANLEARKAESLKAAQILGADVEFMFPGLQTRLEDVKVYRITERLEELYRRHQPAAIFSHGPSNFHKDHILVYEACTDAMQTLNFDFYCYLPTSTRPMAVRFSPQAYVDISDTINLKIDAIHVHSSQFKSRGLAADYHRDVARQLGQAAGMEYAEGLEVMRVRLH